MSASVFNFKPIRQQHEMTRIRTPPPPDRRAGHARDVQKVRRMLFGPVDHEENRRVVEEELARQLASRRSRWEFDFEKGVPLTTSNRCIWSIVAPPQETCKRPSKKPQLEAPEEDNTHLYIDPLEDLISVTDKTAIPSSEEEEGTEKMLTSPVRTATCKKQTTITDFMTVKKSGLISTVKRPTELSVSRPPKLPRTSQSNAS